MMEADSSQEWLEFSVRSSSKSSSSCIDIYLCVNDNSGEKQTAYLSWNRMKWHWISKVNSFGKVSVTKYAQYLLHIWYIWCQIGKSLLPCYHPLLPVQPLEHRSHLDVPVGQQTKSQTCCYHTLLGKGGHTNSCVLSRKCLKYSWISIFCHKF